MIKVSLSDDSMFQMAANAMVITHVQLNSLQKKFMDAARATQSRAISMATARLGSENNQRYRDALSFQMVSKNIAELRLDADAAFLENGYPSFDMVPGMVNSTAIVKVGKRAGQPWVRMSKQGYRYAVVPLPQSTKRAVPGSPGHSAPVQIGQPTETTRGALAQDMERLLKAFGVAAKREPNWRMKAGPGDLQTLITESGRMVEREVPNVNPLLSGLTKTTAQVGKKNVAQYNTFRVVTENPNRKARWRHSGFAGVHIFKDLETWLRQELEKIVRETLGGP